MIRCGYCRTELPDDAMFCGECGRSVAGRVEAEPARAAPPERLVSGYSVDSTASAEPRSCDSCGATLHPGDIFCGECGDVIRPQGLTHNQAGDTVAIDPPLVSPAPGWHSPASHRRTEPISEPDPAPHPEPALQAASTEAASTEARSGELDRRLSEILEDVEDTRIVTRTGAGEKFVLQFSTGESVRVSGSGLIGRNPRSEPAEFVDQFVRVTDPTRSVSKTHLEFGQENGAFWVRDRYSGNGSVVREPDHPAVRCEPGRRYLVARGTRIDIADQFVVVS